MKTLAIILFSLCSATIYAAENPTLTLDDRQRDAFSIAVQPVAMVSQSMSKPYPATVKVPNAQLQVVSAALEGVVEALLVAEGEAVTQGQILARVRSSDLLHRQATFLETRTRRILAAETLARDKKLQKEGIVARRRLLESQAKYRELKTAEERDRQTLALVGMSEEMIKELIKQQTLTTSLDIVAPISGVILEQIATVGQRLQVSDPLYKMGDLSTLWIEVHVPLDALAGIHVGSDVQITEGDLRATVITVGRMVHGADQGVLVRAAVHQGADKLRPGQFVEARLSKGESEQAMRVAASAVIRVEGKDSLFVERDQSFQLTPVKILSRESQSVIVSGDILASDKIVVSGTAALKAAIGGE